MTKLLDQALEAVRTLPPAAQDHIARVVLRLAGADDEAPVPLTPDEEAAIAASKAAAARKTTPQLRRKSRPRDQQSIDIRMLVQSAVSS